MLQADPSHFKMRPSDPPKNVRIFSNLPILCGKGVRKYSCFSLIFETEGNIDTGLGPCEVVFTHGKFEASQTLRISFSQKMQVTGSKTYIVAFRSINVVVVDGGKYLWHGYTPLPIIVRYEDRPMGNCTSLGDPHITSWDGR